MHAPFDWRRHAIALYAESMQFRAADRMIILGWKTGHVAKIQASINCVGMAKPHASADAFTLSRMPIDPTQRRLFRAPVSGRWFTLLIASVLLHFILIGWIGSDHISVPSMRDRSSTPITAHLHRMQPVQPPAEVKPEPVRTKAAKPKPAPRAIPAAPSSAIATAPTGAPPPLAAPEISTMDLAQASAAFVATETGIPAGEIPPNAPQQGEPQQNAASGRPDVKQYKVSIPPSAELKYNVQALRDGQMVYGSGKINWQSDGGHYTVKGEAGILFFTLLNFTSTGVIDDFGMAPEIYSEKRFRRSETNTHFHRERNTISFSASTATYPRKGGEQDRASIIWQLTGIGRGDSGKFKPDAEIDFFVAGVRDASRWRIRVIGQEEIEIGSGKVMAWHVVRIPKQGSYDQKLDIWLAPQHEWYPVKIRFTETNGEYLDMLLSNLTMAATN